MVYFLYLSLGSLARPITAPQARVTLKYTYEIKLNSADTSSTYWRSHLTKLEKVVELHRFHSHTSCSLPCLWQSGFLFTTPRNSLSPNRHLPVPHGMGVHGRGESRLVPQSQCFLPCGLTYLTSDFGRGDRAGPVLLLLAFLLGAAATGSSHPVLLLVMPEWGGPQWSSTARAWVSQEARIQYWVVHYCHTR